MRELYTLNLGEKNSKIKEFVLDKISKNEEVAYVLPTVDAIEKVKREYIDELGGFFNLTFYTFDSLKKKVSKASNVDEPFSLYIVSNILKNNDYEILKPVTSGLVEKTMNFIKRTKEEVLNIEELLNSDSKILRELASVCVKYNEFLSENELCDGFECEIEKGRLNFNNVIVDGFYTFRNIDLLILEELSKNENVIIKMPFYFSDLKVLKDTKKAILDLGYIEKNNTSNIMLKDKVNDFREKISFIEEENLNLEARAIYQELKGENIKNNVDFSKMAVVYASENKSILNFMDYENMELSIKNFKITKSSLVDEFINIMDYSQEANRDNIFRRLDSYYFKITNNLEDMEYELRKINFENIKELEENTKENLNVLENNFDEFIKVINLLKELPRKTQGFKYFSNYFRKYLSSAEDYIKDSYKKFKSDEFLIRDMNILSSISQTLDKLEEYDIFFEEEDLETYINIVKIYLQNISLNKRNDYASKYSSLIETLYLDYDVVFLSGLDEKYPNYKESNFIFSKENKNILKSMGMKSEDDLYIYENELVKIFSLIENSKKAYLSTSSLQSHSIFLDLFLDNNDKKIKKDKATNYYDLFNNVMDNEKNNKESIKDAQMLKFIGNFDDINSRVYGEQNRKENQYAGYLSGYALEELRGLVKKRSLSPTAIDLYVECPFRFLFERVLKVEGMKREFDDEFYLNLGNFYHKVLELYFKESPNIYDEDLIYKLAFTEKFERKSIGDDLNGVENLEFNFHLNKLKDFIKMDIESRIGEVPTYFEKEFKFKLKDMTIIGRIDRIDKLNNGEVLIDYKRKNHPNANQIKRGEKFQIPIYILSRDEKFVDARYGNIHENKYYSAISNIELLGKKNRNGMTPEELELFLEDTRNRLLNIYDEIINGHFPFISCENNNIEELCRGESIE